MAAKIELIVPQKLLERLEQVEGKTGITKTDLIIRAIVKVLEEIEKG
ncbi:MAG: hypothetical protein QXT16_08700 [Candidatus Caldarchaeum sp.]